MQGIADLVLVFDAACRIMTTRPTAAAINAVLYRQYATAQLRLYRRAFAQEVEACGDKLTIYSFAIGDELMCRLAKG